ncbi:MAG: MFS transporter [Lysobacterales bacterium]
MMIRALASVAALLLGVAILLTGQGLQGVLLPVRATLESFSTVAIGVIGATYFLGFTAGCWMGPDLIRRAGHVRVFAAMTALASAAPLLHGLWINLWSWGLLRVISGFCFAVLYVVIESWLNERATNENRGQIFSAYILINMTVLAVGQQILLLDDPQELNLFALASVLVSLAAVPVLMSRAASPHAGEDSPGVDFPALYAISPAGMLGSLTSGLTNGAFWALAAVFAAAQSGDVSLSAWFMTAVVLGGAAGQFPLGWLSDRIDRRYVLASISVAAGAVGLLVHLIMPGLGKLPLLVAGSIWGALAFPVYSISAAHANDRATPETYIMMSSGLLLMYGLGAVIGPIVASAFMAWLSERALFLFAALAHLSLATYVVLRSLRRDPVKPSEHTDFSDALASVVTASTIYEEEELSQD